MSEPEELQPWRAFVCFALLLFVTVFAYRNGETSGAVGLSFVAGMYLQDWGYRLRDKYGCDPTERPAPKV